MNNEKYLLILINQQETFLSYFHLLKRKAIFKVEILELKSFFAGDNSDLLTQLQGSDLCFAGDHGILDKNEAELCRFVTDHHISPGTHFLHFWPDFSFCDKPAYVSGEKAGFPLNKKLSQNLWTDMLQNYLFQLFHKSLLNARLSDYIYHSFSESVQSEQLKKKNQEIEDLNRELEQRNRIDSLTQLYNRKALFDILEKERDKTLRNIQRIDTMASKQSHREKQAKEQIKIMLQVYSVMMIDIDHFKQINDHYGHLVGDRVLSQLGTLILDKGIFRDHDYCARFGGEEFLVILPNTNSPAALEPAVRLQEALKKHDFKTDTGECFKITLSIGISQYYTDDSDTDAIIQRADKALYYAKEHGRDQIVIYEDVF